VGKIEFPVTQDRAAQVSAEVFEQYQKNEPTKGE
jgi:hypothetical protein